MSHQQPEPRYFHPLAPVAQNLLRAHAFISLACVFSVQVGIWQGTASGFVLGFTHLVFFGAYGLALWFGSLRVADGVYTGESPAPLSNNTNYRFRF